MSRQPAAAPQWCMLGAQTSSCLRPRNWQVDFIVVENKGGWRDELAKVRMRG